MHGTATDALIFAIAFHLIGCLQPCTKKFITQYKKRSTNMLTHRNIVGWIILTLCGLPFAGLSQTVDTQSFMLKLHSDSTVVFNGNRNSQGALSTGLSAVDALNETHGAHFEKVFVDAADPPLSQYYYVRLGAAVKNIQGVSNSYNSLKAVDHTQLLSEGKLATVNHPDDPYYNFTLNNNGNDDGLDQEQWHLYNDGDMNNDGTADGLTRADLHMPEAWAVQTGRSDVILGIVDAGIRWTHEDLVNNMWINTEEDANGNGTFEDDPISQGGDFGDANGDGYPGVQGVDDDGDGYTDFNDPGVKNIYTNGLDDDGDGRTDDELGGEFDDSPGIVGFDDDLDGVVDDYDGAIYDDDENGYRDDVIGWDFYNWDPVPDPSIGHGTWVAGEAAADGDNDKGVTGVMQEAQILSAKVFETQFSGSRYSTAVNYATNNRALITNMSFVAPVSNSAINNADNNNVVLVGAAGNDNGSVDYPASHSKVIAVAGLNSYEEKHPNSNYGPEIDVSAYYAPTTGVARGSDSHYED